MRRITQVLTVLALVGILGLTGSANAQTITDLTEDEVKMIQKKREMKEKFKAKMKEALGISDEQQQKLEEHRKAHRKQGKQYYGSIKDLKKQLKAELEKLDFDIAKVRGIHGEMKSLKIQMADQRLEGILQVREILTAEQFKKFSELKEQHKGRRSGSHKGGHDGFGYHDKGPMKE